MMAAGQRAIILAAGLSSRMHALCADAPKCLLELQGRSLLQHQLDALQGLGVADITVVVGHQAHRLRHAVGDQAACVEFADYARGNNLRTLHHARAALQGDVAVLFADVLLSEGLLGRLLAQPAPIALLVDDGACRPDTMRVRLAGERVVDIGSHLGVDRGHGNFVGVAAFRGEGTRLVHDEIAAIGSDPVFAQHYYTEALRRLAARGVAVTAVSTRGERWMELDTPPDVAAAASEHFYVTPRGRGGVH